MENDTRHEMGLRRLLQALRSLVDAVNADNNRAFLFRNCEEHASVIEEAERALSYYDYHGINGEKKLKKGKGGGDMKYIVETEDGMGVGMLSGCVGFGTPDKITDRNFAERLAAY